MNVRVVFLIVIVFTLPLCGCETNSRAVSRQQLTALQQSSQSLKLGMSKAEALAAIPQHGYRNLVGTTTVEGGAVVEEWVVEATWSNNWTLASESFCRYLYFLNDKLVDVSTLPLQYRDRRDLIIEWRNR